MTAAEATLDAVPTTTGALTAAEVAVILARLDPAALQDAGAAQTQLGRELATMAAHLAQEAATLTQNWSGVAARAALAQLQRLHQRTATLATQAARTGVVLTWLGTQVLPALNHPATPTQARQFVAHLTAALTQADKSLPAITPVRTTSPGVTTTYRVPTPARHLGLSNTMSLSSTANPTNLANLVTASHSSPLSPTSIYGHSGQGSPTGTPLISGPTHLAPPVSSLQSAASVPSATPAAATTVTPAPGPAPTPVLSPIAPAATTEVTSEALTTQTTPGAASRTSSRSGHSRDPADGHEAQPPSAAAWPGLPSNPVAAPAPEVTASSPALIARPLPELPTLDSATFNGGLSGGALSLPPPPVPTPAITPVGGPPAMPSFLPPPAGVPIPPAPPRHRGSWATDDPNPWGFPADCVPPLIEGA
ncbi:MAG TPA: hypothetical protein VGI00_17920 [Streptosporangiaceae bacterium]